MLLFRCNPRLSLASGGVEGKFLSHVHRQFPGRRGRQWEERKLPGLEFCLCLLEGLLAMGSIQGDQTQLPTPVLPLFRNPLTTSSYRVRLPLLAPLPSPEREVKKMSVHGDLVSS